MIHRSIMYRLQIENSCESLYFDLKSFFIIDEEMLTIHSEKDIIIPQLLSSFFISTLNTLSIAQGHR